MFPEIIHINVKTEWTDEQIITFIPIMAGFLYPHILAVGKNVLPPKSWHIFPNGLKLGAKVYTRKDLLISALFLQQWSIFRSTKIFQNMCSNLTEKLFLGIYIDKSNYIKVLGSNYIDFNILYSQRRLIF